MFLGSDWLPILKPYSNTTVLSVWIIELDMDSKHNFKLREQLLIFSHFQKECFSSILPETL